MAFGHAIGLGHFIWDRVQPFCPKEVHADSFEYVQTGNPVIRLENIPVVPMLLGLLNILFRAESETQLAVLNRFFYTFWG